MKYFWAGPQACVKEFLKEFLKPEKLLKYV